MRASLTPFLSRRVRVLTPSGIVEGLLRKSYPDRYVVVEVGETEESVEAVDSVIVPWHAIDKVEVMTFRTSRTPFAGSGYDGPAYGLDT